MAFARRPKSRAGRITVVVCAALLLGSVALAVGWVLYNVSSEVAQRLDSFGRGMISGFVIGLVTPWLLRQLRGR